MRRQTDEESEDEPESDEDLIWGADGGQSDSDDERPSPDRVAAAQAEAFARAEAAAVAEKLGVARAAAAKASAEMGGTAGHFGRQNLEVAAYSEDDTDSCDSTEGFEPFRAPTGRRAGSATAGRPVGTQSALEAALPQWLLKMRFGCSAGCATGEEYAPEPPGPPEGRPTTVVPVDTRSMY